MRSCLTLVLLVQSAAAQKPSMDLKHGVTVTALHSHLMMDQPHVLFMHFWGNDTAAKLANALRAALDVTAMAPRRVTK